MASVGSQLLAALSRLPRFVGECLSVLPEFQAPPLAEALRRMGLVLGASLAMIVIISTIDSMWLYLFVRYARGAPA